MAAMYPEAGGQYVYLREAYGEFPAFLYGWMVFTVGQSGTIAALAVGFAEYFGAILPFASAHKPVFTFLGWTLTRGHLVSTSAIILLTIINILGLKRGSALVNAATWAKFAAMGIFVLLGLAIGKGTWSNYAVSLPLDQPASLSHVISGFGVALIAVFWAFDGWVYITWVAGEIKNPQKVLPRAMLLGILLVGFIYMSVSIRVSVRSAHHTGRQRNHHRASRRGCTFFVERSKVAGRNHRSVVLRCGVERDFVQRPGDVCHGARRSVFSCHGTRASQVSNASVQPGPNRAWSIVLALSGSYDQLYTYVMFMMILSYVAGVAALFVLRRKRPNVSRPYLCTGYPYLPALYLLMAGAWALNSVYTRPRETLIGIGIVFLGAPFYAFWRWQLKRHPKELRIR